MDFVCNSSVCTGCSLCALKCPKQCISMELGKLGHLYPVINQKLCVDCKLCQKTCPILNKIELHYPLSAYAAWAKNEDEYKSSTSGGVASVLSRYVIREGGVVYGCSVLPNVQIEHIRVDSEDGLFALKGSKYVQSSITNILPQIIKDVEQHILVLFIGTPCQVGAVRRLFTYNPANLFLVDIICHGTPSNLFLKWYLLKYKNLDKSKITNIRFRSQAGYKLDVYNGNELLFETNTLSVGRYREIYNNTFYDGFTFRKSCYDCFYAKSNRCSDITLGDFWGLKQNTVPNHPYGISVVLPITEKGRTFVHNISECLNLYERPIQEAIDGNEQLRFPKKKTIRIKLFQKLWNKCPSSLWYYLLVFDKRVLFCIKGIIKKLI